MVEMGLITGDNRDIHCHVDVGDSRWQQELIGRHTQGSSDSSGGK